MVKFRPIVVNLLLFGLVAFAIISFGLLWAQQNNPAQSIANDPAIGTLNSTLYGNLTSNYDTTQNNSNSFDNSSITTNTNLPYIESVGGVWKTLKTAPVVIYQLTVGYAFRYLLGDDTSAVVTAVVGAILALMIISAVVYWISRGEGG